MKLPKALTALLLAIAIDHSSNAEDGSIKRLNLTERKQEVVLAQGDEVRAKTQEGMLIIRAGNDYSRTFEWNGTRQTAEMLPRNGLWNGHLGIYNPGESGMWKEQDGVDRVVYEEYCLAFSTLDEAEKYMLRWYGGQGSQYKPDTEKEPAGVWRSDGLVIWWKRSSWAKALNVVIIQILVNGEKPTALTGSQDSNLILHNTGN
jgi:hypothetical protein